MELETLIIRSKGTCKFLGDSFSPGPCRFWSPYDSECTLPAPCGWRRSARVTPQRDILLHFS